MAKGTLKISGADSFTAADLAPDSVGSSEIAANAVGSAEIADDAVTPAKVAYLGDGSGILSGTLTGEQLRFGTAFTLTDDLTVNGDVTLGKVRDDGTGQSLTQNTSANRTITGTGTLRMGAEVTNSNDFPAGYMRFITDHKLTDYTTGTEVGLGNSAQIWTLNGAKITQQVAITSGSRVLIHVGLNYEDSDSSSSDYTECFLSGDGTSGMVDATTGGIKIQSAAEYNKTTNERGGVHATYVASPTGTTPTYYLYTSTSGTPTMKVWFAYMTFFEIYQ
jgi:hypothetical protein